MERPTCKTCPYWFDEARADHSAGDCRRHAPRPSPAWPNSTTDPAHWPEVYDDAWCGEHPDFLEYIASLKKQPTRDEAMTLARALYLHGRNIGNHGWPDLLSMRVWNALESPDNPYLNHALASIREVDLIGNVRCFGKTAALEFREWRKAMLGISTGHPNGPCVSPPIG